MNPYVNTRSEPMGTDGQMDKRTNKRTDGQIFAHLFRDKLSLPKGSSYFYHRSDLHEIIQFLREIECIEFECNEFVLVLVQIDLIHFEHSICISST